jgi:hypothetical protein
VFGCKLAEGGTLVSVGHATSEGEHFPFGAFFGDQGPPRPLDRHFLPARLHIG